MLTYEVHDTEVKDIERIFHQQKANQFHIGNTGIEVRKEKLSKLHEVIHKYRSEIKDTLFKEYHKPAAEVDLTEIFPITGEIKFAKKNLSKWIKGERRKTPFALMGASSRIRYEPKGVVLIISPWNFPFNLTFGPLVSAIAAGNCVIVKPSEMTPLSSKLIKKIVAEVFHESEVAVVEGGVPTSQALLELPFNHIFFTGSPGVGKIVMEAAAKNLASVTLELGGKSPTVIDETADLKKAAKRVSWVKLMNNGQMCITPDYVIVHESVKKEFIKEVKVNIGEFY
ncbi:MAG: aldehyde dehydrogenase family protein, partial [Balneolales bacterium]|nr:aldehyde dehydrogenase family protein [Balneolales bacterium]